MTTTFSGKHYRITFLTERLVRLEYQPDGLFEDRPTTCVRQRDFPPVHVDVRRGLHGLELDTAYLHLVYDEAPFSASGLSIALKGGVTIYHSTWRYQQPFTTLGGTARTLDTVDGRTDMGDGLVSRNGFSVLDDSRSMLMTEEGGFAPRTHAGQDLYFFGYGHDYTACLRDYYRLSGAVPMLPRWALGNWWSRYHEYTEESYLKLMDRFEAENVPLSVAVIDMDWHLTHVPYGSGWTGYTWNRDFFPQPERFLADLHRRGIHTTLNLHPAGGVEPHEERYASMCQAMGRDPEEKRCIDFDAADPHFMQAYFQCLHHPLEEQGVDFWWIDWQQGATSAISGLDPLWVLNEQHYRDICRRGGRGMILSRYAGPGSHRTPVGFSGDTVTTWESLAFQPEFTATAANIGYPWWSHDIGGHMYGVRCDELAVRWLQFGVFSPILRLHSSKSVFASKEPWSYGAQAEAIMKDWLRLRHQLIPYLYTAMERTHRLGEALVRPIYYRWPDAQEAYQTPNQYLFGPSLMVCPITSPMDPALNLGSVTAWLPEGRWFDFQSGQIYTGGRMMTLWRPLESYPVLAQAGAIVPLSDEAQAERNPQSLTLRIFAGADGQFDLYEDDGLGLSESAVRTHIALDWASGVLRLHAEGDCNLLPSVRTWHVECIGFANSPVTLDQQPLAASYDAARNALCFTLQETVGQPLSVQLAQPAVAADDWRARALERLHRAQVAHLEKDAIWELLCSKGRSASTMGTLRLMTQTPALADCLAEVLFAQDEP